MALSGISITLTNSCYFYHYLSSLLQLQRLC